MKILYLFGPNLGALGRRDPETYGSQTLGEIMAEVETRATAAGPRDRLASVRPRGRPDRLAARGGRRGEPTAPASSRMSNHSSQPRPVALRTASSETGGGALAAGFAVAVGLGAAAGCCAVTLRRAAV